MGARACYVTLRARLPDRPRRRSGSEDTGADPEGEFLGLAHASQVYALWGHAPVSPSGMPDAGSAVYVAPRGYQLRVGDHALTAWDWQRYADVADQLWR